MVKESVDEISLDALRFQRQGGLHYCFLGENENGQREVVSHPVLRPNRMLIVCVPRNQFYTHTLQKMDTE
jgi:hypothetical protein